MSLEAQLFSLIKQEKYPAALAFFVSNEHIASSPTGILASGLVQRESEEKQPALTSRHIDETLCLFKSRLRRYKPSAEELEDGADVNAAHEASSAASSSKRR